MFSVLIHVNKTVIMYNVHTNINNPMYPYIIKSTLGQNSIKFRLVNKEAYLSCQYIRITTPKP